MNATISIRVIPNGTGAGAGHPATQYHLEERSPSAFLVSGLRILSHNDSSFPFLFTLSPSSGSTSVNHGLGVHPGPFGAVLL